MADRQLVLVGASGLAREVLSAVAGGREVVGAIDEDERLHGGLTGGLRVLGGLDSLTEHSDVSLVLCVGKGASRRRLLQRLASAGIGPDRFATVVHPSVHVPTNCEIGRGSIVLAGSVITADVKIGSHVVLMPNVTLTHDDVLEDFVTVAAGVQLGGDVLVESEAYLGMGSCVRERLTVGRRATLGMGSVLLKDLPAGEVWGGVPAGRLGLAAASLAHTEPTDINRARSTTSLPGMGSRLGTS